MQDDPLHPPLFGCSSTLTRPSNGSILSGHELQRFFTREGRARSPSPGIRRQHPAHFGTSFGIGLTSHEKAKRPSLYPSWNQRPESLSCHRIPGRAALSVVFCVRRGKAWIFSGCNSRPATGSLQPVRCLAFTWACCLYLARASRPLPISGNRGASVGAYGLLREFRGASQLRDHDQGQGLVAGAPVIVP